MILPFKKKKRKKESEGKKKEKTEIKESKVKTYKPMSVGEKLDSIREDLDILMEKGKYKKGKDIKLPRNIKTKLKGLIKKNQVLVFLLQINRGINAYVCDIKNEMIVINNRFHHVTPDFVFMWQGRFPCIILPEWSLQPVGTKDYYDAVEKGMQSDPQDIIIKAIEANEAGVIPKKKIDVKTFVILGIIALVAGYVLFGK